MIGNNTSMAATLALLDRLGTDAPEILDPTRIAEPADTVRTPHPTSGAGVSYQRVSIEPLSAIRTLKIEADGDPRKGVKPKIRIMGRWLERAGFRPGERVSVTCISPGVIELRSPVPAPVNATAKPRDGESDCPF